MTRAETYQLSTHAVLRALERTTLSAGQLLERLELNAVAWLPARMPEQHKHALIYCATEESYVVAVIQEWDLKLKTVLELGQWENLYWKVPDIWLTLARHATAQCLALTLDEFTPSRGKEPAQAMDVRLVAKIDGPKGPKYQTLLEKSEEQWTTLMGSSPAERRRVHPGFLSKLAVRLLEVTAFAEQVRHKLHKHMPLVEQSDYLLLVFGPASCPVPFLPQIDVGLQLPGLLDKLSRLEEKRRARKEVKKSREVGLREEKAQTQPPVQTSAPAKNKDLLAMLVRTPG